MMDFIMVPLVVGIVTLGIYKLFELFVRKRERLTIIEKIGDKFDPSMIENKFSFPEKQFGSNTFATLKIASLLLGIGLGLLVGFFIFQGYFYGNTFKIGDFYPRELASVIFGASVLLFGGLGLLISFLVEMKYTKKH